MRRTAYISLVAAAFAGTFLVAGAARADLVEPSAGVKLMAGGSLWTTPSDRPGNYDGIGFAGNGGGFSYGAGPYFEVRFIKLLSLEIDVIYDKSVLLRNVSINNVLKVQERLDMTNWRIPILAKGNIPTPFGRLFVLLGPEFVVRSSTDASLEVIEGNATLAERLEAKSNGYTMLTAGLGLTIDVVSLEIPIELRVSKNLGQEDAWPDRVERTTNLFTVDDQTSWDFRMSAGLGYKF